MFHQRKRVSLLLAFFMNGKVYLRFLSTNYINRFQVISKQFKNFLVIQQIIDNAIGRLLK